jgi:heme oxygenase (biliverdin-IX-beta and delta-forming)
MTKPNPPAPQDGAFNISMHDRLRVQTRALHEKAETAINLDFFLSSRVQYCRLLQILWRLHAGFEPYSDAHRWADSHIDLKGRRRAGALLADLAAMGSEGIGAPIDLSLYGPQEAIGGLYVLEGSTLGGRIILRQAQQRLGVDATCGASFLHGYGAGTALAWKTLIAAINNIPAVGDSADAVERGAKRTFAAFIAAFDSNLQAREEAPASVN